MNKVKLSLIVLVCINANIFAGSLEPPGPPGSSNSAMYTIEAVYQRLDNGTPGTKWTGGFREPTAPPGSTMHNLNDVMAKAPSNIVDSVGATTNEVLSGQIFWGLTTNEWGTLTGAGDPDLVATNIVKDVTIFGVTGTAKQTLIPKTGQTNSVLTGDDGNLQKGVTWPNPRFTIGVSGDATNLVTDNMTGLMWARNANMWGQVDWTNAVTNCNSLVYGGYDDWRLPNMREMYSLIHWGYYNPAVPNTEGTGQWSDNNPFTGVESDRYWTATAHTLNAANAWHVRMSGGHVDNAIKPTAYYVWPVRGGP